MFTSYLSSTMQSCWCNVIIWVSCVSGYLLHRTQHDDRDSWCACARPNSSGNQRRPLRDNQLDTRLDGRLAAPAGRRLDGLFPGVSAAAAGRRSGGVVAGWSRGGEENLGQSHFGTVPRTRYWDQSINPQITPPAALFEEVHIHSSSSTVCICSIDWPMEPKLPRKPL